MKADDLLKHLKELRRSMLNVYSTHPVYQDIYHSMVAKHLNDLNTAYLIWKGEELDKEETNV